MTGGGKFVAVTISAESRRKTWHLVSETLELLCMVGTIDLYIRLH